MTVRAYAPGVLRQQRADTLVYSRDDILRALSLAVAHGAPANLRLGADIMLPQGFTIPAGVPQVQINGGNTFGFRYTAALPWVVRVEGDATELLLSDVSFRTGGTAQAATLLAQSVEFPAGIRLRNVAVDDTVDLLDPVAKWARFSASDCQFSMGVSPSSAWSVLHIRCTTGAIINCQFVGCPGDVSVELGALGGACTFVGVGHGSNTGSADTTAGLLGNGSVFSGCYFQDGAFKVDDIVQGWLNNSGTQQLGAAAAKRLALTPTSRTFTGINPTLDPTDGSWLNFTFSGTSSGTPTISTAGAIAGQLVVLRCVDNIPLLSFADAGSQRLSAAWTPNTSDALTLGFDGSVWIELSRSNN